MLSIRGALILVFATATMVHAMPNPFVKNATELMSRQSSDIVGVSLVYTLSLT
jgi:hypothetical protein